MTAPRKEIETSLAERGRPVNWATEQEAAVLCGLNPQKYRRRVAELESQGFPRKDPVNGLRYIPAIEAFWASRIDSLAHPVPQSPANQQDLENFGGKSQRRAS